MKAKSIRLADIMGADFKGSQSFTDFVINGVKTSARALPPSLSPLSLICVSTPLSTLALVAAWRPDLGVETKNSELFYQKTEKQQRKEMALKRKEEAKEARMVCTCVVFEWWWWWW